jgi:hypothetical protein
MLEQLVPKHSRLPRLLAPVRKLLLQLPKLLLMPSWLDLLPSKQPKQAKLHLKAISRQRRLVLKMVLQRLRERLLVLPQVMMQERRSQKKLARRLLRHSSRLLLQARAHHRPCLMLSRTPSRS